VSDILLKLRGQDATAFALFGQIAKQGQKRGAVFLPFRHSEQIGIERGLLSVLINVQNHHNYFLLLNLGGLVSKSTSARRRISLRTIAALSRKGNLFTLRQKAFHPETNERLLTMWPERTYLDYSWPIG
jgi:hypothetical protein